MPANDGSATGDLEQAQVLSVIPSPVANDGYKGYEALNPAFVQASIALLARLNLLGGGTINQNDITAAGPNLRYLQASLDCLEACGFLEKRGDNGEMFYEFTSRGMVLAEDSRPVTVAVDTYGQVMRIVKNVLGDDGPVEKFDTPDLLAKITGPQADRLCASWVVPAVTVLSGMAFQGGRLDGENVAEALAEGKLVRLADLMCLANLTGSPESSFDPVIRVFSRVLEEAGLLESVSGHPYYRATPEGRKVFAMGGYSELILSYFQMLKKMDRLTKGELTYGPDGDVGRDPKLNARASSRILEKRVAPYIGDILRDDSRLSERIDNGATIDFGSGGGEMVQRAADAGECLRLRISYGMDVSAAANEEARSRLDMFGMARRTEIVEGSILNEKDLQGLADRISGAGIDLRNIVATINFILHDVGHKAAEAFLHNYAKIFGDAPLIVTETMKMSQEVLRAHPNYQATSFQFIHTASGQELFTEPEILALFERCGFRVLVRKVHSSMPGVNPGERHATIITFTIQHQKADRGDCVDELDLPAVA